MAQAFYTGVNGIQSHQYAIDVVADNLANVNTTGFRSYSAEFASLYEKSINTHAEASSIDNSVGIGTRIHGISMNENSGAYILTDRSTDLAIMGDGWFGIQSDGEPIYTRDGNFVFDTNRDLVTTDGFYVLGTMGDNVDGEILTEQLQSVSLDSVSKQEKIRLPRDLLFPVQPTTEVNLYGNLGIEDEIKVVNAQAIDSQNQKNNIRLEFTKIDPQVLPGSQWSVVATAQSTELEPLYNPQTTETTYVPKFIYDTKEGVVEFDEAGALLSSTITTVDNNGSAVIIDLGTQFGGLTATDNTVSSSYQSDGVEAGTLSGYDININGEIIAAFTNGKQSSVGTIAVFHFQNDRGLDRLTGTRFTQSSNSGEAIFYKNANGENITGVTIVNHKLEGSNVEIEAGLTELIILQRSYDANSKSITTADQMMQKALEMDAK